jgi:hypothetical protein
MLLHTTAFSRQSMLSTTNPRLHPPTHTMRRETISRPASNTSNANANASPATSLHRQISSCAPPGPPTRPLPTPKDATGPNGVSSQAKNRYQNGSLDPGKHRMAKKIHYYIGRPSTYRDMACAYRAVGDRRGARDFLMFHSAASPAAPSFAHRSATLLRSIPSWHAIQRNSVFHPSSRSWRSVRRIRRASLWVAVPDFMGVGQTGDSLRVSDTDEKSCSDLSVAPCRCEPHPDGIELGIEDLSANTYAYSSPLHMDLYLSLYLFPRPPYPTVVAAYFACSSPASIESTTHPVSLSFRSRKRKRLQ